MQNTTRSLLIAGVYPALLAVMTGAAWLDGVYAHALRAAFSDAALAPVFSQAADAQLLPAALTWLAGLVAVVITTGRARWLCVASLAVLSLQFLLPALASAIPAVMAALNGNGLLLRMALLLGALAGAFFSLRETVK
jgi:hypothetical protein